MGGLATPTRVKNGEKAKGEALAKVKADKEREATIGHDGTWGAHPGMVELAKEAFDRLMPTANQIASKRRDDVNLTTAALLHFEPEAPIAQTRLGLDDNISIHYRR